MRRLMLACALTAWGCVAAPPPTTVTPRQVMPAPVPVPSPAGAPDVAGHSDLVATWDIVAVRDGFCQLAPSASPVASQVATPCPADTPLEARVIKSADGSCSLVFPRPECGFAQICDPRPAQAVACPTAP